jgi:hypothetical protein
VTSRERGFCFLLPKTAKRAAAERGKEVSAGARRGASVGVGRRRKQKQVPRSTDGHVVVVLSRANFPTRARAI